MNYRTPKAPLGHALAVRISCLSYDKFKNLFECRVGAGATSSFVNPHLAHQPRVFERDLLQAIIAARCAAMAGAHFTFE